MLSNMKYRVGQKSRLFLTVDNFATVRDREACDISKVYKFCLEKKYNTCMPVRLNILCQFASVFIIPEITLNLTITHGFYSIFTQHIVKQHTVSPDEIQHGHP